MPIRPAVPDDAEAAALFHVAVWRDVYRTLAPQEAHQLLDFTHRLPGWRAACRGDDLGPTVWLAEDAAGVTALLEIGTPTLPEMGCRGEVRRLYVAPRLHRTGLGRQMMTIAFDALHDRGYRGAALCVVQGNEGAMRFYEALGGRLLCAMTDPGPIWKSMGWVYTWDF